jgi:SAM-dependent methyltransferase
MTSDGVRGYAEGIDALRTAYDGRADQRDTGGISAWKVEERNRFLALLPNEGRRSLLEVGAGTGVHGLFFQEQGMEVICTDLSPEHVRICRQEGLTAFAMDFLSLEFGGRTFDAVFAMNCLLHVPRASLGDVLRSIRSVMAPGGLFYLGQYGGEHHEGPFATDIYTPPRYFSFLTDEALQAASSEVFEQVDFRKLLAHPPHDYYQALILRRAGL